MFEGNLISSLQQKAAQAARKSLGQSAAQLRHLLERSGTHMDQDKIQAMQELVQAASEAEQHLAEQSKRIRQLERLSLTDELTGLLNRRGFDQTLKRSLAECNRHQEEGILVICDLNRFKQINDIYGHLAGDACLREVAQILSTATRGTDIVCRLGGDEFSILMPRTAAKLGERIAVKLQSIVNSAKVNWEGKTLPITAAVGFHSFGPGTRAEGLFALADMAMYRNKQDGRRKETPIPATALNASYKDKQDPQEATRLIWAPALS